MAPCSWEVTIPMPSAVQKAQRTAAQNSGLKQSSCLNPQGQWGLWHMPPPGLADILSKRNQDFQKCHFKEN